MPMLLVELKWGPVWREERRIRIEKKKEEQEEKKRGEEAAPSNTSRGEVSETGHQAEMAENEKA